MRTNVVYQGDCIQGLKLLPDNSVDLILTDPPFNVSLNYSDVDDNMNDEDYYKYCLEWIKELLRVLKYRHYAIIFSGDKKLFYVMRAIYDSGFQYHHLLKWYKPQCQRALSGTVVYNETECAFIVSKGKPDISLINKKVFYSDTLRYKNTIPNQGGFYHPASRPVLLYDRIIKGFTKDGDIVLDPFMGSGTTALACRQLNRRWVGFEISPEYCKIIEKRLSQKTMTGFFDTQAPTESFNKD